MNTDNPDNMREHILGVADRLFYEEGIRSAGMDKIIAEAGIAKATLYRHFPSKETLVLGYLQRRHTDILNAMGKLLESNRRKRPEARIAAIFDWVAQRITSGGFRGCAFLLALGEYGHLPTVREAVYLHKKAIRDLIRQAIGPEQGVKKTELVDQLVLLYDGGIAAAAVHKNTHGLKAACKLARRLTVDS